MEKDGDFACAAEADVAPFVCSAPILPLDKVIIEDLVSMICIEGLVVDLSLGLVVEFVGEASIPLQPLLILVELHCILLETPSTLLSATSRNPPPSAPGTRC